MWVVKLFATDYESAIRKFGFLENIYEVRKYMQEKEKVKTQHLMISDQRKFDSMAAVTSVRPTPNLPLQNEEYGIFNLEERRANKALVSSNQPILFNELTATAKKLRNLTSQIQGEDMAELEDKVYDELNEVKIYYIDILGQ